MKLIQCVYCLDWVKMHERRRWCECCKCSGLYVDSEKIHIAGPCIPFGINNFAWQYAKDGHLATFEGWFYHTGYISTPTIFREDNRRYDTNKIIRLGYRLGRARRYVEKLEQARAEDQDRETMGESE